MGKITEQTPSSLDPNPNHSEENQVYGYSKTQVLPPGLRISRSDPAISNAQQKLRLLRPYKVATGNQSGLSQNSSGFNHPLSQDGSSVLSGLSHHSSDSQGINFYEMKCRICFLNNKESDEKYICTGCHCAGFLQFAHTSCLQKWIDTKGSRECECCLGPFSLDLSEEAKRKLKQNSVYIQMSDGVTVRRVGRVMGPAMIITTQNASCRDSPRTWLTTSFVIMILATTCSAALTAYAHKEMDYEGTGVPSDSAGVSYGLALTFLVFCISLTFALGCFWVCAELAVWPIGNRIASVEDVIVSDTVSENNDLPQTMTHT